MIKYLFFFALLLNACAHDNTNRVYFEDTANDKPHAILQMEEEDSPGINLFGATVAAIKPLAINGLPVDSSKENWKLHAFGEFVVPAGDTMLTLRYQDRDNHAQGFVRFTAQAGQTYQVTHRVDNTYIHFDVHDEQGRLVTTQTFHKWQYIWKKTPQEVALLDAVYQNDLEQVQALLKQGVNPNWSAAYRQFKPVTVAAAHGRIPIIKALIQAGADINPINQITPLEAAATRGHAEVVALLLEAGAYPDLGTPLIAAAEHGYADIVKTLLQYNAYTLSRNPDGLTAFALAQRNGHQEVAQLLRAYPH